ncbi:MAG: hypothetical protein AAF196_08005 [Planctomycetota bacterium]
MRLSHVLLFLAAFGLFGLTARGRVANTDTTITTQAARAWLLRGDPALLDAGQAEASGVPTWAAEQTIVALIDSGKYGMHATEGDPTVQDGSGRHYIWFPIGYQALIVPCVKVGRWLAREVPKPEVPGAFIHPLESDHAAEAYWTSVLISWLSPLGAALAFVALASLGKSLGATGKQALWIAFVATLCTQFWPGTKESLSNMPGAGFALLAIACIVAWLRAGASRTHLLWAGIASGISVLIRYPSALSLLPFWIAAAVQALGLTRGRSFDWKALALFVVGGLPFAVLLVWANIHRFGRAGETGYSPGQGFGSFPFDQGLVSILFAPGKGVLWFTPLLVGLTICGMRRGFGSRSLTLGVGLAIPVFLSTWMTIRLWVDESLHPLMVLVGFGPALVWMLRSSLRDPKSLHWLAVLGLLAPIALFSNVVYWAAGMCWGIRYLSAPIAVLVVFLLVKLRPWEQHRRALLVASGLGFFISLGGIVTEVPYQHVVANHAIGEIYENKREANLDLHVDWHPLAAPWHSHWTMFLGERIGTFDHKDAAPFARAMYGVELKKVDGSPKTIPLPVTAGDGRGFWWRNVEIAFPKASGLLAFVSMLGCTLILFALGGWMFVRRDRREEDSIDTV